MHHHHAPAMNLSATLRAVASVVVVREVLLRAVVVAM